MHRVNKNIMILGFIFTLCLLPNFLMAINCSICHKSIRGQYIKTDSAVFCSQKCYNTTLPNCTICNKKITAQFIKSKGKIYCSEKCYNSTLPKCSYCHNPCSKQYINFMNKTYCSKECIDQVYKCEICHKSVAQKAKFLIKPDGKQILICYNCSRSPICFYCHMPYPTTQLNDGRRICQSCDNQALKSIKDVQILFQQLRDELAKLYGYDNKHKIYLRVIDNNQLKDVANGLYQPKNSSQLALMRYSSEITTEKLENGETKEYISFERCQIFVLANTPQKPLIDALVHELTHDHLRHNIGKVNDLANEEGFCELVAYLYNQSHGLSELNQAKINNPDPIYGAGFRKMYKIYNQTKSLKETIKSVK